jgi:osmotically-inducible protein OsmY
LHSFRGRGPKGYERSDARVREIICERLTDDPRIDASDVSVEVTQKVVRLSGSVDDRRTKYAIEDLIERCGVKDIDNQLRVHSAERPRSRDYSAMSQGSLRSARS